MKPIAIFRHFAVEGPGYLATLLDRHGLPWVLVAVDAGDPLPATAHHFSGLIFMGGPMSVNDDLPWIEHALNLIREAVAADIPVMGHCLGGQLMAKALGGVVSRNPIKEIGWGQVDAVNTPVTSDWMGHLPSFIAFHWHGETFSLPPNATCILTNAHCTHQAFVIGPHLGMQCHIEMTDTMIEDWCEVGAEEISASNSPAVQTPDEIRAHKAAMLPQLHTVADALYTRWISRLKS
jgi:GMP synthase-like glutamine amidotransferase